MTRGLKRRIKFAPRMSRECRAEFLLTEIGAKPRQLSPEVLAKLKPEIVRIGLNGGRRGFAFAQRMFRAYPQLRTA